MLFNIQSWPTPEFWIGLASSMNINTANVVHVMPSPIGNDGTGMPGRLDLPFATNSAAHAAASSGMMVFTWPGNYTEITPCYKSGVNWHLLNGAIVTWAPQSGTAAMSTATDPVNTVISGDGIFIANPGGTWSGSRSLFYWSTLGASTFSCGIECLDIIDNQASGGGAYTIDIDAGNYHSKCPFAVKRQFTGVIHYTNNGEGTVNIAECHITSNSTIEGAMVIKDYISDSIPGTGTFYPLTTVGYCKIENCEQGNFIVGGTFSFGLHDYTGVCMIRVDDAAFISGHFTSDKNGGGAHNTLTINTTADVYIDACTFDVQNRTDSWPVWINAGMAAIIKTTGFFANQNSGGPIDSIHCDTGATCTIYNYGTISTTAAAGTGVTVVGSPIVVNPSLQ